MTPAVSGAAIGSAPSPTMSKSSKPPQIVAASLTASPSIPSMKLNRFIHQTQHRRKPAQVVDPGHDRHKTGAEGNAGHARGNQTRLVEDDPGEQHRTGHRDPAAARRRSDMRRTLVWVIEHVSPAQ